MVKLKLMRSLAVVTLLIGCFAVSAVAQSVVGKIDGYVKDKSTNEALVSVNVTLLGTDPLKGAATDADGYFYIMNVPPGTYTVVADYIGYRTINQEGYRVIVDATTSVNFSMEEQVLDIGAEIIVEEERSMVQRDRTSKITTLTTEEIIDLPVADLTQLLATQSNIQILSGTPYQKSGYETRGFDDIRMRGGRNNELTLMIDGMSVKSEVFGGFGTRINNFSIGQMSIQAGGFDASYGNALSGVINISTREGGNRHSGSLQYNTSRPFGVDALATEVGEANNRHQIDYTFAGPVPGIRGLTYFVGGDFTSRTNSQYLYDDVTWDDHRGNLPTSLEIMRAYAKDGTVLVSLDQAHGVTTPLTVYGITGLWINPLDTYTGMKGFGWNNGTSLTAKLTFRINNNMKISFQGRHSGDFRLPALRNARMNFRWPVGEFMWLPEGSRVIKYDPTNQYATALGEVLTAYASRTGSELFSTIPIDLLQQGYYYNKTGMGSQTMNFIASQTFNTIWNHTLSQNTFYTFRAQMFNTRNKTRPILSLDNMTKNDWWIYSPNWDMVPSIYQSAFSPFNAADPWDNYFEIIDDNNHFSGDETFNWQAKLDLTSQVTRNHQIKTGIETKYLDISRHDFQRSSGVSSRPTIYQMFPVEGGAYITDKIEFASIVLNLGIRLDYANSKGTGFGDPLDPLSEQSVETEGLELNPWKTNENKFKVSPRIGIAFPLTDVSVIHFNFGHFYQQPNYRDLYRGINDPVNSIISGNIQGNPNLTHEKSIQYEIGLQQQLGQVFSINANLWIKETTNQVGSVRVNAFTDPGQDNPYRYSIFVNNNFGSAKGLDLTIQKRYSNYFSGNLNYTLSKATVLQPTSWDGYWSGATTERAPKQERIADWDQTHVVRTNIDFNLPLGYGPEVLGFKPLSSFGLNLIWFAESGFPYTPGSTGSGDEGLGRVRVIDSDRLDWTSRVDVRFRKLFTMFDLQTQAFVEIRNFWNTQIIQSTNSRSTANGLTNVNIGTHSITYLDGLLANNLGPRRNVSFGFRLRW